MVRLVKLAWLFIPIIGYSQQLPQSNCEQLGYYNNNDQTIRFQENELSSFEESQVSNHVLSVDQLDFKKLRKVNEPDVVKKLNLILDKTVVDPDTSHSRSVDIRYDLLAVARISGQNYTILIFAQDQSNIEEQYTAKLLYMATLSNQGHFKSVVSVSDTLGVSGAIQMSSFTVKKGEVFTKTLKFQPMHDVVHKGVRERKRSRRDRHIKFRLTPDGFVKIVKC